ncbi:MAG: cbb3-type cytochrome oxidase assembly protein CcoS [Sinobacteraceae bacterium]|nr:cbb3-type cytochrome oxidase assembly protein CcoS [Nevskiaceae bacterium]
MASMMLLIPLSLLMLGAAVWAFFWAVDRGQFEDLEQPSRLALEEDQLPTADAKIDPHPHS